MRHDLSHTLQALGVIGFLLYTKVSTFYTGNARIDPTELARFAKLYEWRLPTFTSRQISR